VQDREVFSMTGFPEFQVYCFQINYTPGVQAHQYNGGQQFAEGIGFMNIEYR
jgi:hypothetical protein